MTQLHALLVAVALVLAGCSGGLPASPAATPTDSTSTAASPETTPTGPSSTGGTDGRAAGTGTVDFYLSDEENAIGDFAHVNVTVTQVGFQRGGEAGSWVEYDVENVTVDLTELQGPNATYVDSYDLSEGEYSKVFIYVDDVQATLETGEEVRVKLPSEKLQLKSGFTLENGSDVEFVFDITVKKAGNSGKYILQPVISESGTNVPIESPNDDSEDDGGDDDGDEDDDSTDSEHTLEATVEGNVSAGENVTVVVTRNDTAVENASVTVNDDLVGTTDADGELTVAIPDADTVTVVIEADGEELELEYELETDDES